MDGTHFDFWSQFVWSGRERSHAGPERFGSIAREDRSMSVQRTCGRGTGKFIALPGHRLECGR